MKEVEIVDDLVDLEYYPDEQLDNSQADYARYFIGDGNSRNNIPIVDCRRF